MDIYKKATLERKALDLKAEKLQKMIQNSPPGDLHCYHSKNNHVRWYHYYTDSKDGSPKRKYISAYDRSLAETLARKGYYTELLQDCNCRIRILDRFIKAYPSSEADYNVLVSKPPELLELIGAGTASKSTSFDAWQNAQYEKNEGYPDGLKIQTVRGEKVRSKSEALIANVLYSRHLAYRYECALYLNGMPLFPDFIIPSSSADEHSLGTPSFHTEADLEKIVIIEHFGLMDNDDYRENCMNKISKYMDAGFLPSHNAIFTYETTGRPLDLNYFTHQIRYLFD